jgi:hypothetical protein
MSNQELINEANFTAVILEWVKNMYPVWVDPSDVKLFCSRMNFESTAKIEKALFELANEGFVDYSNTKAKQFFSGGINPCFRYVPQSDDVLNGSKRVVCHSM